MTQVLSDFIKALRAADVRVSTAESIDAASALDMVGFEERGLLKQALSQVLAKSHEDKQRFDECFEAFFHRRELSALDDALAPAAGAGEDSEASADGAEPGDGETGGGTSGGGEGGGESLAQLLEAGDGAALEQRMAAGARAVQLENIRLFTQRGMYVRRILESMGVEALDELVYQLIRADDDDPRAARLQALKARLVEDVSELVDRQMLLYTANAGRRLREDVLQKTPLARIESRDFKVMHGLVSKLAKRLVALHARRRHVSRRGQLDVRHTIRRNIEYDGLLFDTVWKRVRVDRPKVIAVCDVSGSVAQVARFLLLFLYSMTEVIPKVRAFAFSNYLGEVTELFETRPVEDAVVETINAWGMGSTDYGGALAELERLTLDDIDHRTTVIILGDARSNYGDPGHRPLRRIHERARRVLWLNPEPPAFWNTGDSEMQKLGACCDRVAQCRTLRHLEQVVSEIARTAI
ncbi:MAG: VWA domain-containing protein [Gammaproteobacteria bacterium]